MSKVIPKESLENLESWSAPFVGMGSRIRSGASPFPDSSTEEVMKYVSAKDYQQLKQQAYKEGLAEGREAGLRAVLDRGEQELAHLRQLLQSLAVPFEQLDQEVEQELVILAKVIARHMVKRELRTNPEEIIGVVRDALAALPVKSRNLQIFIHPEDATLVKDSLSDGKQEGPAWQIIDDATLERGGCRVSANNTVVDATLEARLTAIVTQALGGERGDDRGSREEPLPDDGA